MDPNYKPIQPHPGGTSVPASSIHIQVEESESRKRRRSRNHIACDRCRKEEQILERLKDSEQHRQAQSEFMNRLRTLPIEQASEMLRQLRENPDFHTTFSSSPANNSLVVQPSGLRIARAMAPPTGSATEFELAGQFSVAYPWIPPVDLQSLRGLLRENADNPTSSNSRNASSPLPTVSELSGEAQSMEMPEPKFCDSRLENLQISYWKKISISNEVAASLISFYIENDHKILGFFDADLFLDDLVTCRQRFCSPFLQGYAAIKPGTNDVRIAAFQEAEMLWQGERSDPSLISMAAMALFSFFCIFEGKDVIGQECTLSLRHNAERLGVCGDHFDGLLSTTSLNPNSPEWVKAASIHVVYYQHTHIPFPPALPIPGDPRNGADFDPSRSFRGSTFSSACRLWMIAQEVLGVYNFAKAPISERVPLSFAEAKYQKLLVWVGGLDEGMKKVEDCPYEVIIFHRNVCLSHLTNASGVIGLVSGALITYLNIVEKRKSPSSAPRTRLLEQRLSRVLALLGNQGQGMPMSGFVAQLAAEDLNLNVLNSSHLGQLPLSQGLTLLGTLDVVDRGFVSLAEAQSLLDNYRNKAAQHFPFVPIASDTTVASLRSTKPFLFMCIIATMKVDNCSIQHQIGEEIRNQAHQRVLMQSESTLEILQGLLIYLAWYQYFFISYEKQQIVPIAQLCVSLIQNLGLDQNPDNMRRKVDLGPDETAPGRKAARSAEQLRALLGTYCTASWYEEDIMLGFSDMIWAVAAAYEETKRLEPGLLSLSIGGDGQNSSSELGSSEGYLSSTGSGNMQPEAVLDFGLMEDETWEELLAGIATVIDPASSLQV
ncbi:cercosporin resistance protein [Fusarium phyllophilum]|uniref:Cercosporin resistance protein n=1 Tax=Fusarium phyllophilum TaxID=47803 RepID=A0A8H5K636_9HYPO|nr:cercosporin resistance protein [Fusarium phyllophilum]